MDASQDSQPPPYTGEPPKAGYPPQQAGGYPPQQPGGYPPQQPGGYPPQQPGGYPPQQPGGYPPQQPGGYPPQQPGYPPQQPGYPPQPGYIQGQTSNVVVVGQPQPTQQTVIVQERQRVNHALHCIITFFFFPWIIVWIILCIVDES